MIAHKTWREIRWMVLVYTLIPELLLLPAILLWPSLRDEGAVAMLGKIIPIESFKHMFSAMSDADGGMAYRAYMAVQMYFKGVNIVGISCAVLLATSMIARERENHTLEFLLARPITRRRVLGSKFAVIAIAIVVPIFLTSWSAIPLSWLVQEDLPLGPVTLGAMHSAAFVLLFAATTCLASVSCRSQMHAAFWVGGAVIVQLAVYFIQTIRVGSIFMLSDFDVYGPIMAGNHHFVQVFFGNTVWVLAGTVTAYSIADRVFGRADL